jgi:hypothetical protein
VGGVESPDNSSNIDVLVSKYSSSGDLMWNKTWGGPKWDYGVSVSFDDENNVYIFSNSDSIDSMGDIVISKYNSSGFLEWNRTWGTNDTEIACDIKIDTESNVYFTGYSIIPGICNVILVKLNNSGDLQWNRTWGGPYRHIGNALTVDSSNNVLIAGVDEGYSGIEDDIFVCKVNSTGDLLWNYTYVEGGRNFGFSLVLDSKENIFVAGFSDLDMLLIKLNQTGSEVWAKTWGSDLG